MSIRSTRSIRPLGVLLLALVVACGSDSTGPVQTNNSANIAGTYAGGLNGVSQGIALAADFSITISQSGSSLSGSWSMAGQITDGVLIVDVLGTGALTGSIGMGSNPSVNITITNPCPNYQANFSGAYDGTNRVITLNGPVDILESDCSIFRRYQGTILLYN